MAFLRYGQYHTPEDTEDKVDVDRLTRTVSGLVKVVEELSEAPKRHRGSRTCAS